MKDVYAGSLENWLGISFAYSHSSPMYGGKKNLYFNGELAVNITIPDGFTSIVDCAFLNCSSLTSITIPDSVTSIGSYAFSGCSSLTSIAIPDSVTSIGSNAFYKCSCLTNVTIPKGVTNIGFYAFSGCNGLTYIKIPTCVISGNSIDELNTFPRFFDSTLRAEVDIWGNVTSINSEAFSNCHNLTSITFLDSVTSIGSSAFYNCISLTNITLPEGVTSIGYEAFCNCSSLTSITIPDSVTSIDGNVFYKCSSLTNITIPDSVTSIGGGAFRNCDLTRITIPESVTSIGNYAFNGCINLKRAGFLGFDVVSFGTNIFPNSTIVYCYEYSDVDIWATDAGYEVVYLDNFDENTPVELVLLEDCSLKVGKSLNVKAEYFPTSGMPNIQWSSSDPTIVSVDNGKLTALKAGQATITAVCGSVSDTMIVTASVEIESFEISASEVWIVSKQTMQLSIENIYPADASTTFNWNSSDTFTLTVDNNGLITAKSPGDATVTVMHEDGISRSCLVQVCYPVTGIEFSSSENEIFIGEELYLTANITTRDNIYVNKLVSFVSSNEDIATVNENGIVNPQRAGAVIISATATSGVAADCIIIIHSNSQMILPKATTSIAAEAFVNSSASEYVLPEGVLTIAERAFADSDALELINLPDSITQIAENAFEGCDNVMVICVENTIGHQYALAHEIPYIIK